MEKKTVHIPTISCGHCVAAIKRELGEIAGVTYVSGDAGTKEVTVEWESPANWDSIKQTLDEIGYSPEEK